MWKTFELALVSRGAVVRRHEVCRLPPGSPRGSPPGAPVHPSTSAIYGTRRCLPRPIFTSSNPAPDVLPAEENAQRNERLKADLERSGLEWRPAIGRSSNPPRALVRAGLRAHRRRARAGGGLGPSLRAELDLRVDLRAPRPRALPTSRQPPGRGGPRPRMSLQLEVDPGSEMRFRTLLVCRFDRNLRMRTKEAAGRFPTSTSTSSLAAPGT